MIRPLTALGSVLAVAGAVHSVVNARRLRRASAQHRPLPQVSVLIPARDEADQIAACLKSVLGQPGVHEVLVLDDESGDGTGELAAAAGAAVVAGTAPPPGWLGKPWACAQLAAAADPRSSVLVFLDADVRLEPAAVRTAARLLLESGLELASPCPRQVARTVGERLVQPLLAWSWLTTLPLGVAEGSPRRSLTAATGQFLLVRRAALERAGGFAAVRHAVLDDLELARAVKASGGRAGVVDGSTLASCRMYDGWTDLRDGYAKSLWTAFGSPAGATGVLGLLAVAYLLPPLAALRGSGIGALGYAAAVASRVVAARTNGVPAFPDALAHPASIGLVGYLTGYSFRERSAGRLRWRNRPL